MDGENLDTTINDLKLLLALFGDLKTKTFYNDDIEKIVKYLEALSKIKNITVDAFNNPETQDINLYRAQALANIKAVFVYELKEVTT